MGRANDLVVTPPLPIELLGGSPAATVELSAIGRGLAPLEIAGGSNEA
jgi:hypothetical protein